LEPNQGGARQEVNDARNVRNLLGPSHPPELMIALLKYPVEIEADRDAKITMAYARILSDTFAERFNTETNCFRYALQAWAFARGPRDRGEPGETFVC